ncbi:hypothetical protein T492DRAFT_408777 [Pavlovales sp. CCMP2436]|nr:hypothetical protein T492DRAFT_408777 [Pavlovales sp. CCMP2436]
MAVWTSLRLFALARSMAGGASDDSEISPCVTPPRGARHGGYKACQCKLLVEVDGVMVSPCKGWGLQMAQQSGSLHGHADRPTLLRMLYTGLGFDKQNASDADEAELIVARWTGDTKDTGNYEVSVFHFDAASIHFTPKTVAFSKVERQIWPSVEPGLVRTQLALAGTAPAMAITYVPDGVPFRLAPEERDLRAGKRPVGELAAGGRSPTVPKARRPIGARSVGTGKRAETSRSRAEEMLLERLEEGQAAGAQRRKHAHTRPS